MDDSIEDDDVNPEVEDIEYSTEIEDMLLDVAWRDYSLCFEDKKELENKVSILLPAIGVILGLIVVSLSHIIYILALFATLLLFISAILCVLTIYMRQYEGTSAVEIWKIIKIRNYEDNPKQAKRDMFATLDARTNNNRTVYNRAVFFLEIAIPLFIVGIFFLILSFIIKFSV